MAIRTVLRLGDPRLRRVAAAVPAEAFGTAELGALLADLRDTMAARDGAGLAAPQIGVPLRLVIFGVTANPRYPEAPPIPQTVLINPLITPLGPDRSNGWEGCLSVPGLRGSVPRWSRIRYEGLDAEGRSLSREVAGFHARVVQHECDHLDGVLFPDRIEDRTAFGFTDELAAAGLLAAGLSPPEQ
ncbi:peptide deformylase [Cyanobium sp. NIES-981]|uniref:peptide deformylase n=1 Tax=Cyanobium sp. NIES-981 TaxID=1851505 RepID=UPI0007DDEC84|nr:peptide deformylase [Cyanobium sp. NIES-981]SBO42730.1 Peptide deformylase 1 [Cyanobium sp. NIES-981]